MRRYQLVIGGTVAGTAAVLAFPTQHTSLQLPTAAAGTSSTSSTEPTTAASAASGATGPTATAGAAPTTTPTTTGATRSATSATEQFRYGEIAVKVTVAGTKITSVGIATLSETDGRSQQIDQYALPQLERQVVSAGSVQIDGVSGATFTSQAFVYAIESALGKLGITG